MNPEPFYLFLTGGAGTGKTHLVKAIQYEASRILARSAENPDDITVLLTAPTGVAAFNIGASTIHSTFSIGTTAKLPYQPLGDEKINTLRLKLASLQILIIDEISMVDHKLLSYIHGRLRQIKQTGDYSSFGKVSIIAVGDFYQLPPVKARPLYVEQGFVNLFTDNFKIAELTDIMRQKDAAFAQMLNRLRVRKKGNPLDAVDVNMLRGCETGIESDAIHIFATNNEVDMFNVTMLHSKCSDSISIKAQDFSRNPKTGKLEKRSGSHVNVFNTCLARMVNLALNARVMLTKNIDLADGLVNGVFGTLTHISCKSGEEFPIALFVLFDVEKVGQKVRKTQRSLSSIPELSTRIEPQEDRVNSSGDVRRQFPLKLAWACTTHKVQGLTVNESVVSLLKIFAAGQAYVALSRVSSLEGLTIQDFKESSIYCNENVETALTNMPQFLPNCTATLNIAEFQSATTIVMHNIEGLPVHIHDLRCDSRFLEASVICLTETWLSDDQPANEPRIEGFSFVHRPRSLSYNSSDKMFAQLKSQSHGGVGVYTKEKSFQSLDLKVTNLEYMAFFLSEQKISIAVVYRPQSYKLEVFKQNLLKIGFEQALSEPTTECGTLLDHVYIKNLENVKIDIVPTYYGYHEGIRVTILNS